ncbi:MAG: D-alanyl-D-alanine carboxypeptidase family protein, partial [Ruminococcus sp.]|nr:D-alanyl-D-alanine carboxypeptidase family protein [Ruminococcus sp.]
MKRRKRGIRAKFPIAAVTAAMTAAAFVVLWVVSLKKTGDEPVPFEDTLPPVITDSADETKVTYTQSDAVSLYEISAENARADEPDDFDGTHGTESALPDMSDITNDGGQTDESYIFAGGEPEETDSGEITDISLTFYEITMNVGDVKMPIVTMYPEDAEDKSEIWESSDSSIAEVDEIGNITAVSAGECVIRVRSAASPDVSADVRVRVLEEVTEPTYINGILIANKTYALPRDYNPGVDPAALEAFDRMQEAAAEEGLDIYISSGFRSYDYQSELYEGYVRKSGKAEADRYSARPGHSEHQSGLAFDLNTIDWTFEDTAEYEWVRDNCADYGFIIRYPKDKEEITGYMYEPWHIRYLGVETAEKVSGSGLTLEEYLGIDSKYAVSD